MRQTNFRFWRSPVPYATNLRARAWVRIIVFATLGKPFEVPVSARWCAANRTNTMKRRHGQLAGYGVRSWLRRPSKEVIVDRIAAGCDGCEPLPKTAIYCHLLPFCRCKTATTVSTVAFLCLAPEGVPASLGPGLRTVSGAIRSLGAKLSPERQFVPCPENPPTFRRA